MDGESARRKLFDSIIAINRDPHENMFNRLWLDAFDLYCNNEWEKYRITPDNITPEEIQLMRQLVTTGHWIVASSGKDIWRKMLSGMVYLRVEILPEVRDIVQPHTLVDEIARMENVILINIEERPPTNSPIVPEEAKDCDHYWWKFEIGSKEWNEHSGDVISEYRLIDD